MSKRERIVESLSTAFLLAAGASGVFVSILDLIGADFESGFWSWIKGPLPIILLIVSVLAVAVGLERHLRFQRLDESLTRIERIVTQSPGHIIASLDGVEVIPFADVDDLYTYVIKRMGEATKSIDDLTWGSAQRARTLVSREIYNRYINMISVIASEPKVAYREIMSFPPLDYIDRAERILRENHFGYHFRYYVFSGPPPPLLSMMIVDSEEVIIGFYREPYLPMEGEFRLAIRHPVVAKLFRDFYNTIWQGAQELPKDRDVSFELEKIRRQLR